MYPCSISYCEFYQLNSESSGGALFLNRTSMSLVQLMHSFFSECFAPKDSGAVYCQTQNLTTAGCCYSSCATLEYLGGSWGTAANIETTIGCFTSHVAIYKCTPNYEIYKGHIAYSNRAGQNTVENSNLTECQSAQNVEGYHFVYAEQSTLKYSIGVSNSQYGTVHSRESIQLDVIECIFSFNSNVNGVLAGATPMYISGCTFFQNSLVSRAPNTYFYNCVTSSASFGTALLVDTDCKLNIDQIPGTYPLVKKCVWYKSQKCSIGEVSGFNSFLGIIQLL